MRIAVTGVGMVTALGPDAETTWAGLLSGARPFQDVTTFPTEGYRCAKVAQATGPNAHTASPGDVAVSRTSEMALIAAREALAEASLPAGARIGLVVGGTTAGMYETESLLAVLLERAADPAAREEALSRMLSHPLSAPTERVARVLGPFHLVRSLSSACSSGANAIATGAVWLELGLVDAVVCGAADALCRVTLSGFGALGALDPDGARPFDVDRRGLTLGEGAGFLVLEPSDAAAGRGRPVLAELLGWASRSEAHHVTNPEPTGKTPAAAMQAALARAAIGPADVDFVNAHGTGTSLNDVMEARAIRTVFGPEAARIPVTSNKGQLGHTLGASGAIEAAITVLAIARGVVPPNASLTTPDATFGLHLPRVAEARPLRAAVSSSFGFGGMDTVLAFGGKGAARREERTGACVVVTGAAIVTDGGVQAGRAIGEPTFSGSPVDLTPFLDGDRARRLDRTSRLAAVACESALGKQPRAGTGIVLGAAFGAVDATAAFMRRLQDKGPRLVSPADFPNLVPSSPAGNVSIYLGLDAASLVVADLAASGECAFVHAFEAIRAGEAERMCACAAEERSVIVEQVLGVLFGGGAGARRGEGCGAVVLAAEDAARKDGSSVLARVVSATAVRRLAVADLGAPSAGDAWQVMGSTLAPHEARITASPWARARRVELAETVGRHEATGAIAIATAVAAIARGDASDVLVVGSARPEADAPKTSYAIVLARPR